MVSVVLRLAFELQHLSVVLDCFTKAILWWISLSTFIFVDKEMPVRLRSVLNFMLHICPYSFASAGCNLIFRSSPLAIRIQKSRASLCVRHWLVAAEIILLWAVILGSDGHVSWTCFDALRFTMSEPWVLHIECALTSALSLCHLLQSVVSRPHNFSNSLFFNIAFSIPLFTTRWLSCVHIVCMKSLTSSRLAVPLTSSHLILIFTVFLILPLLF